MLPQTVFVLFSWHQIDQVSVPDVLGVYVVEADANRARDVLREDARENGRSPLGYSVEEFDLWPSLRD